MRAWFTLLALVPGAGGCAAEPAVAPPAAPSVAVEQAPPCPPPEPEVSPAERARPTKAVKKMDDERLDAIFRELVEVERRDNVWKMNVRGLAVLCITDERFDRMRIVAPVAEAASMTEEQRARVLEANFHTALDARYAVHDGVLYSVFIHPLSPLTEDQVRSALGQVVTLVATYGGDYTSGALRFGGG